VSVEQQRRTVIRTLARREEVRPILVGQIAFDVLVVVLDARDLVCADLLDLEIERLEALSDEFLGRFFVVQNASDSNEIARESDEVVADFVDGILDALARGGRDALIRFHVQPPAVDVQVNRTVPSDINYPKCC